MAEQTARPASCLSKRIHQIGILQLVAWRSLFRARDEKPISATREIRRRRPSERKTGRLHCILCAECEYISPAPSSLACAPLHTFGLMLLWPLAALNKTQQRSVHKPRPMKNLLRSLDHRPNPFFSLLVRSFFFAPSVGREYFILYSPL